MSDTTATPAPAVPVPAATIREHVTLTPGVCGGKPCIAGHRIRVQDVYFWHEVQGQSVDEIVAGFPQLTHADVYAALAYYWDNQEAIHAEIKRGDEIIAQMQVKFHSKLQDRLEAKVNGDSIPPR